MKTPKIVEEVLVEAETEVTAEETTQQDDLVAR